MLSRLGLLLASFVVLFLVLEVGLRVAERVTTLDLFHVTRSEGAATETTELRTRDFIQLT